MAVSIRWCCKHKCGIKLVEPSDNLAVGYLKMAEDALGTMNREKDYSLRFSVSACYYSMYYSLYSILVKMGVKCEIHSCTLKVMEEFLGDFYSGEEIKIINKAFDCRNDIQYYVDKIVERRDSDFIILQAPLFFTKSKEILARINELDINKIREKLSKCIEHKK